ncbi:hypothetical protein M2167_006779 [Streptomyces sp. SPB4]|nr:hypothetical protein [Streptomyces sp. SPB4]
MGGPTPCGVRGGGRAVPVTGRHRAPGASIMRHHAGREVPGVPRSQHRPSSKRCASRSCGRKSTRWGKLPDTICPASGDVINDLGSLPRPTPSPPVFDDPHGRRRRTVTALGALVGLLCLCVLAIGGSVLYADPKAPTTPPAKPARPSPAAPPAGAPGRHRARGHPRRYWRSPAGAHWPPPSPKPRQPTTTRAPCSPKPPDAASCTPPSRSAMYSSGGSAGQQTSPATRPASPQPAAPVAPGRPVRYRRTRREADAVSCRGRQFRSGQRTDWRTVPAAWRGRGTTHAEAPGRHRSGDFSTVTSAKVMAKASGSSSSSMW